jgi:aminoglycoside 3-N-acetyltransferase
LKELSFDQLTETLTRLGVSAGDGLLVHSAIQYLGRPPAGIEAPALHFQAIRQILGADGTLAVPAFNFAFARGEPYDPQNTPSAGMGVFSEYVRRQPEARRTPHPMQSVAVIGRRAADLAGRDTADAFDPGSAFERMLELGFKLLLLGADIQAVSMLHYSEQRRNVPYRYWKDFTSLYLADGVWEQRTYRRFVRDLEIDARISLHPVQARLEQRGQWRSLPLNYGNIAVCLLTDFTAAVDELLAADPWSLVTNRPDTP